MAHKIQAIDRVYLAAIAELSQGKGWHGLGIPTELKDFNEKHLAHILFGYRFADAGVMIDGKFVPSGERYAIADGATLGSAVSERWETPNNGALFELFKEALAGSDYDIVSAGTIDGRIEFFVDAKAANIRAGGRDIAPFVGLHRSFGGLRPITVNGHQTVIQCGNTTALFLAQADKEEKALKWRNCPTNCTGEKLAEIQAQIQLAHNANALFAKGLESASAIEISKDDAKAAFLALLTKDSEKVAKAIIAPEKTVPAKGKKKNEFETLMEKPIAPEFELSVRAINRVTEMTELFLTGAGNEGKTACDWLNAFTDYYTHESSGGKTLSVKASQAELATEKENAAVKQWYSSEYGSARAAKTDFVSRFIPGGVFNSGEFGRMKQAGVYMLEHADAELQKHDDFRALLAK